VVVKRTLTKNVMSVCTKILLQMNAKAGGALWTVKMPLPGAMFIGYDVCHDTGNRKRSVGAFVASLNGSLTEFYSSTHFHENREELSNHLESDIRLALGAYQQVRVSFFFSNNK
jgi:aubergine-like protein